MESTAVPGVHVLGDATFPAPLMPKSGHMANQHAKVAASRRDPATQGRVGQPDAGADEHLLQLRQRHRGGARGRCTSSTPPRRPSRPCPVRAASRPASTRSRRATRSAGQPTRYGPTRWRCRRETSRRAGDAAVCSKAAAIAARVRYRPHGERALVVHCCHCRWCQREAAPVRAQRDDRGRIGFACSPANPTRAHALGKRSPDRRSRVARRAASRCGATTPAPGRCSASCASARDRRPDRLPPDIHIFTASKQPLGRDPAGARTLVPEFATTTAMPSGPRGILEPGAAQRCVAAHRRLGRAAPARRGALTHAAIGPCPSAIAVPRRRRRPWPSA